MRGFKLSTSLLLSQIFIALTIFFIISTNVAYASFDTSDEINMIEFPDSFSQLCLIENNHLYQQLWNKIF